MTVWDYCAAVALVLAALGWLYVCARLGNIRNRAEAELERLRAAHLESVRQRIGEDVASLSRQIADLRKDLCDGGLLPMATGAPHPEAPK